ncbi:MAG: hypothetical protein K5694_02520 [Bacilli bacterium]|nr:hypothetical protein [Bacilli bacterium]
MKTIYFSFTVPYKLEENRDLYLEYKDFITVNVYTDGEITYFYQKYDPSNRKLGTPYDEGAWGLEQAKNRELLSLIDENYPFLKNYIKEHRYTAEGGKRKQAIGRFYDLEFLINDFLLDPSDEAYIQRYRIFPDKDVITFARFVRKCVQILDDGLTNCPEKLRYY